MSGILDDGIAHAFDPRDVPNIDERIIRQSPARDLAMFPDFDGMNPTRAEGSQRPRDYNVPMGYGGDFMEKPTRAGCVAIDVPLTTGPVYTTPGALLGWQILGFDPAAIGSNYGSNVRGWFRDRSANGSVLLGVVTSTTVGNILWLPMGVNFSSLYLYMPSPDAAWPVYVKLVAYVIPTE